MFYPFPLSFFPLVLGKLQCTDVSADTFWTWPRRGAGRDQLWLEQSGALPLLYPFRLLHHFCLPCSRQGLDPVLRALHCGHLLHRRQLQQPQPYSCYIRTQGNHHWGQRRKHHRRYCCDVIKRSKGLGGFGRWGRILDWVLDSGTWGQMLGFFTLGDCCNAGNSLHINRRLWCVCIVLGIKRYPGYKHSPVVLLLETTVCGQSAALVTFLCFPCSFLIGLSIIDVI